MMTINYGGSTHAVIFISELIMYATFQTDLLIEKSKFSALLRTFPCSSSMPVPENGLWLIERGIARTLTWSDNGDQIILGYWGAGDVVGQSLSRVNPYSIECVSMVEARLIEPEDWSSCFDAMLRHCQQSQQLLSLVTHDRVPYRLVRTLNWLAQRFSQKIAEGVLIDIPLTHLAIADLIGSSRVTVTRLLSRLKEQGLLKQHKQRIILQGDLEAWLQANPNAL
jgi:CRP-like cAMP-binding protein